MGLSLTAMCGESIVDRRSLLAGVPLAALLAPSMLKAAPTIYPGVHAGDRIAGANFATRSAVWGVHGAAATAHPYATMIAIDVLKRGGSAVDAAIAANAVLGSLEPVSNGMGGDCFVMLWDPKAKKVVGLNGSGRSPRALTLDIQRRRARDGYPRRYGATAVSVPGAVDAWWTLHQRYGKLPFAEIIEPAAALAERGVPMVQTIGFYMQANMALFLKDGSGVEETENARRTFMPNGPTPREGEIFRNPDLARTLRMVGQGGRDAFYQGEIADTIERYFKRIGGWMTKADLAAHTSEWTQPLVSNYRGVDVYGLAPNTQGLTTLQLLNILETFDVQKMGFQSAAAIHHAVEAKRLAFEDRARFIANPDFSKTPIEWLNSKEYARERAKLIKPNRILTPVHAGQAPSHGDTTYFCTAAAQGMMVSMIQSNY